MIINLSEEEVPDLFNCDVCIAGGGAAGITIARELAGTNLNVILLESGGLERDDETSKLNEGSASGNIVHGGHYLESSRLRYFGGATNHWGGFCRPLDELDFLKKDWVPNSGWPFTKDTLEPYYRRAEEVVEIGSFAELDHKQNLWGDSLRENQGIRAPFWQFSPPTRFGSRYKEDIEEAENIRLLLKANLTNIRLKDNKEAVDQVQVQSLEGASTAIKPKLLILAGGGIENPRIMLNCRDDMPDGIGNQNGIVGKYFMEHPHIDESGLILTMETEENDDFWKAFRKQEKDEVEILRFLALNESIQQEEKLLNFCSNITYLAPIDDDNYFPKSVGDLSQQVSFRKSSRPGKPPQISMLGSMAEQMPSETNQVSLTEERDALGMHRVDLKSRVSSDELEIYQRTMEIYGKALGLNKMGRIRIDLDENTHIRGGSHHMGTTRMSDDPKRGVVDKDCKVHGLDNLYIAGSSVFPTAGCANPTLTLLALAVRLSDHVKKEMSHE